jgi:thiamine biosynthesis lipoprotein
MRPDRPTRRRALTIFAATAAGILAPDPFRAEAAAEYEWRGTTMGAEARLCLSGLNAAQAADTVALATQEIERLEQALSLFRPDSEICRLNRHGMLDAPSADFRRAVSLACTIARASGGLFDPTVQALWETYVDWFTTDPERGLPPDAVLARARQAVDWRGIAVAADVVRLDQGQRITLNGMGQGYVTDRIADLLRARGLRHVLIDLGEQCALGPRHDGSAWQIAREDAAPLWLSYGALATSEGRGCILGAAGAAHHLFDPRTGRSAHHWRRLTVHHGSAAVADALSTALSAAAPAVLPQILARIGGIEVWARDAQDMDWHWPAPNDTRIGSLDDPAPSRIVGG